MTHTIMVLSIVFLSTLSCFIIANIICQKKHYHFATRNLTRLGNIDGLRGYLALGVLFNHFMITYHWKTEGAWNQPPEYYFTTFGQTGVTIFFMITGYLFTYKLLSTPTHTINWKVLYLSRFFRLVPLHIFVTFLVIITVIYQSSFIAYDTPWKIFKDSLHWVAIVDLEINQFQDTRYIAAAVFWTLRYEWLFYLSLPFIAFFILRSKKTAVFSILFISFFALFPTDFTLIGKYYYETFFFLLFLIGGVIAKIQFNYAEVVKKYANHYLVTLFILLCLFITLFAFETVYAIPQSLLLALFFMAIAFGNDLFGLLKSDASIFLGEISYSIYLMHGFIFYLVFSIIFPNYITVDNREIYMLLMPLIAALCVLISWMSYLLIEKPMMRYGKIIGKKYLSKPLNFNKKTTQLAK